jgi:lysophospholipase L1-like esterase
MGFRFHLYPTVQFGWPTATDIENLYKADPDVVWVTQDFDDTLARARETHPAVVFLGDSCTEWGSYPAKTLQLLHDSAPGLSTGEKFGIGGWSSEQGLALLRRDVLALKPKVVTFYFGWNDHWVSWGPTDQELLLIDHFEWLENHFRLAQLLLKVRNGSSVDKANRPNRVPLARYEHNLRAMVAESRAAGIQPVLITAPSNHVRGEEPEYLLERQVRTLDDVVPLHDAYLEVTRRVARETGATLCDVAETFSHLPHTPLLYFRSDGIHLMDAGDQVIAAQLAPCIRKAAVAAEPLSGHR